MENKSFQPLSDPIHKYDENGNLIETWTIGTYDFNTVLVQVVSNPDLDSKQIEKPTSPCAGHDLTLFHEED